MDQDVEIADYQSKYQLNTKTLQFKDTWLEIKYRQHISRQIRLDWNTLYGLLAIVTLIYILINGITLAIYIGLPITCVALMIVNFFPEKTPIAFFLFNFSSYLFLMIESNSPTYDEENYVVIGFMIGTMVICFGTHNFLSDSFSSLICTIIYVFGGQVADEAIVQIFIVWIGTTFILYRQERQSRESFQLQIQNTEWQRLSNNSISIQLMLIGYDNFSQLPIIQKVNQKIATEFKIKPGSDFKEFAQEFQIDLKKSNLRFTWRKQDQFQVTLFNYIQMALEISNNKNHIEQNTFEEMIGKQNEKGIKYRTVQQISNENDGLIYLKRKSTGQNYRLQLINSPGRKILAIIQPNQLEIQFFNESSKVQMANCILIQIFNGINHNVLFLRDFLRDFVKEYQKHEELVNGILSNLYEILSLTNSFSSFYKDSNLVSNFQINNLEEQSQQIQIYKLIRHLTAVMNINPKFIIEPHTSLLIGGEFSKIFIIFQTIIRILAHLNSEFSIKFKCIQITSLYYLEISFIVQKLISEQDFYLSINSYSFKKLDKLKITQLRFIALQQLIRENSSDIIQFQRSKNDNTTIISLQFQSQNNV